MISDFLGPADRGEHSAEAEEIESEDIAPFVAKIEVQRRRVTKDGRVKLKLSLLGVSVAKCGVCLSQFKDAEWAALGATCQHASV
jgi:hypothetical protein